MLTHENHELTMPTPNRFANLISAWFDPTLRDLPWRKSHDPYAIWIAEVMLQQTTVFFAATRFLRWMEHYPTLESLAEADEREVLIEWEGLGYYSRARNVRIAAQQILEKFGGKLPANYDDLTALPGIGDYTANAILALAFDQTAPAMDVNIRRVLSRVIALNDVSLKRQDFLREFLTQALKTTAPRSLIEALMELGQTVCVIRTPSCKVCPLNEVCASATVDFKNAPSVAKAKIMNRREEFAIIAELNGSILVTSSQKKLFRGMHLLPAIPATDDWDSMIRAWAEKHGFEVNKLQIMQSLTHRYTSNIVKLSPVLVEIVGMTEKLIDGFSWILREELNSYPMPSAHRKLIELSATVTVD